MRNNTITLHSPLSTFHSRKGVTLLLVLGLMTMFAMLVTTFMVVVTQARRTSEISAQVALGEGQTGSWSSTAGNAVTPEFDKALELLLIGDQSLSTVLGPHSILENLYGHPLQNNTEILGGTFGTVSADTDATYLFTPAPYDADDLATAVGSYYRADLVGYVLTVKPPGDLQGQSTFILDPSDKDGNMLLAPFKNSTLSLADQATALAGCEFVINSPAFSGTGPGYNPTGAAGALLTGTDGDASGTDTSGVPFALRPNILAPNGTNQTYKDYLQQNVVLMNPDYTAPDFLNMFLAWNEVIPEAGSSSGFVTNRNIPSFHRPDLVRYHNPGSVDDLRKIVLRPLRSDHQNFTGSNAAAAEAAANNLADQVTFLSNGPWDVDNDGDGVQDGIWLDVGLPVQTIGGKQYRPLVSYYVLDMSGRLNVNAHGNLEYATVPDAPDTTKTGLKTAGTGMGAAEIRLDEGLKALAGTDAIVKSVMEGRYGTNNRPGDGRDDEALVTGAPWWLAPLGMLGINAYTYAFFDDTIDGLGGIRPDLWGTRPLHFDEFGNRDFSQNDAYYQDNPYLFNPYGGSVSEGDDAFKDMELDYILRSVGDRDFGPASMSVRLRELLESTNHLESKFSRYRHHLTTRSSDIPAATRLAGTDGPNTDLGLFQKALRVAGTTGFETLYKLLPEELRRGEKINVNRVSLLPVEPADDADHISILTEKSRFAQSIFYTLLLICYDEIYNASPALSDDEQHEAVRRLAQWSVNLVDFIDADAVMTPLIYKLKPIATDDVYDSGSDLADLLSDSAAAPTIDPPGTTTGLQLVWGMEKPEVAMTETWGKHNRRVANAISSDPAATCDDPADIGCPYHPDQVAKPVEEDGTICDLHDKDYDQVMVPQGSVFVELFRNGGAARSSYTNDLYEDDGSLDLAKQVQHSTGGGFDYVWRIAAGPKNVDSRPTAPGGPAFDWPNRSAADKVHDALYQSTHDPNYSPNTQQWPGDSTAGNKIERMMFFGNAKPSTATGVRPVEDFSYYNQGTPVVDITDPYAIDPRDDTSNADNSKLKSGEYMLIGPRTITPNASEPADGITTPFGQPKEMPDSKPDDWPDDYWNPDSWDGWSSEYHVISMGDLGGRDSTTKKIIAATRPTGWGADLPSTGFNVSEPIPGSYYPAPTEMSGTGKKEGYASTAFGTDATQDGSSPFSLDPAFDAAELHCAGTIPAYATLYLQRLADPRRPWDAVKNPYVTVDWNMVDLQVFNSEHYKAGESETDTPPLVAETDEEYPNRIVRADIHAYGTRQWGRDNPGETNALINLWSRVYDESKVTGTNPKRFAGLALREEGTGVDNHFYPDDYTGYRFTDTTLGGRNDNNNKPKDESQKDKPFLPFPWNDGPLNNSGEVMMIPTCSASRFGLEFYDTLDVPDPSTIDSSVDGSGMRFRNPLVDINVGPYLNFQSTNSLPLARFLDLIRVPSRFNGTIQGWTAEGKPIYSMSEPGKVNLNTADDATWQALRGNVDSAAWPSYADLQTKRSSNSEVTTDVNGNPLAVNFQTPFRSPQAVNLVPVDAWVRDHQTEATLWGPLPDGTAFAMPQNSENLALTDPKLNPYTTVENTMRMSDLVTNRSNVFAVWMTIGYFEAEKFNNASDLKNAYPAAAISASADLATFHAIYPEGYVLGTERGLNDGTVTRHRKFFLIDRSIPVGFRRGVTYNHRDGTPHYKSVIVRERVLD